MLECKHLVKDYIAGDEIVHAINDLSVTFRENEFVSILGPSGCGKTTLLNIIGGLDSYTSGDLIINGTSTKNYTDKDWDTYRNHRVGFVFQNYNLIMHQSVVQNVELSMTLTGVGKEERHKRAVEALEKVGLGKQINKKPTQLSGGQMQRVAIARALVNNPEIVLADEPTGALDSHTSVQIMDLLKEIAKDRLVIMVTHNPELAEKYSTRIIRLKDGQIQSDSKPVTRSEPPEDRKKLKKPSMSFWTALSLSFNNLLTKKGRTFLTAFAGSIGIIGIGLIMSISNGMQNYINQVETDTMTSYPITIEDSSTNMSTMMSAMMDLNSGKEDNASSNSDTIKSRAFANTIMESLAKTESNNLTAFKSYLESPEGQDLKNNASAIEYDYGITMHVYNDKSKYGLTEVSPNGLIDAIGMGDMISMRNQLMGGMSSSLPGSDVWMALPSEDALRDQEYELIDGHWPQNDSEVVLEVDGNNEISDFTLYSLGLMNQDTLVQNFKDFESGKTSEIKPEPGVSFTKEELLDTEFTLVLNSDMYEQVGGIWVDKSDDEAFVNNAVANGKKLKVSGIIKPKENSLGQSNTSGGVYYPKSLQDYVVNGANASAIVQDQKSKPDTNIFTGQPFGENQQFSAANLSAEQQAAMASMTQDQMLQMMNTYNENANASYASNLQKLGSVDYNTPTGISIYAETFDKKEEIENQITDYNNLKQDQGDTADIISYNDVAGTMMSGVSDIINIISSVLIAFVSVSLIVSSIMIGIITYISVLERVKEIGILRAMGASKRDIRNVFNAETFIIGLLSGVIGIVATVLIDIPASIIIKNITGVANIAVMPWQGALLLIAIELVLTVIAGLIPANVAAKKNPVEALRTE